MFFQTTFEKKLVAETSKELVFLLPQRKIRCATTSLFGVGGSGRRPLEFTREGVLGDWLQTPLRHASNPCGPFSLRASASWCVLGPTEGATTHHYNSLHFLPLRYVSLHCVTFRNILSP